MSARPHETGQAHVTNSGSAVIAHVLRSGELESAHRGSIAVADASGRLLAHVGDHALPVFWRSAAKLHQAIPLVLAGGIERWGFSNAQIAVMCGSHNGEPEQVSCVSSVLRCIGLGPEALRCGAQEPYGSEAANELVRRGEDPGPLHNTCSGNHAGLLALGRLLEVPTDTYDALANPIQQRALEVVATFADVEPEEIFTGVDGCGIPAYRTPLVNLATAFARLVCVPAKFDAPLRSATSRVVNAVASCPEFIGGNGELDTECIRAFGGAAICKLGAEAVCAAAFAPTAEYPDGIGIAIKIQDGLGNRARAVALAEVVAQLNIGRPVERAALDRHVVRQIKSRRGEVVGEILPMFDLNFDAPGIISPWTL